jgi:hypothetical protein
MSIANLRRIIFFALFFIVLPLAGAEAAFVRNLSIGMSGADVHDLQVSLNTDPETRVAAAGPGSPGYESAYFGAQTKAAVIRFQEKYASEILEPAGLRYGTGFVGVSTREKLRKLAIAPFTASPPSVLTPAPAEAAQPASAVSNDTREAFVLELRRLAKEQNLPESNIDAIATRILATPADQAITEFYRRYRDDLAAKTALDTLKEYSYVAPTTWKGIVRSLFSQKKAEAVLGFGGIVSGAYTGCNCPPGVILVYVAGVRGGVYAYAPLYGTVTYASYNLPYARYTLGTYIPGIPTCWVTITTGCAAIPSTGMMTTVGSSPV